MKHIRTIIIEDEPVAVDVLQQLASALAPDISVEGIASDGIAGMRMISELKPDLIFLDIDMPDLNGFRCLTELKKHTELSKTPVVMYSSSFHPSDIEKAYLYGANLYLTKPSSLREIRDSFMGILQLGWEHPEQVTATYFPDGKYKRFQVPE